MVFYEIEATLNLFIYKREYPFFIVNEKTLGVHSGTMPVFIILRASDREEAIDPPKKFNLLQ